MLPAHAELQVAVTEQARRVAALTRRSGRFILQALTANFDSRTRTPHRPDGDFPASASGQCQIPSSASDRGLLRVDHYQPPSLSQSIVILRLLQASNPSAPIRPQAVASYPSLTALVPSQLDHDTAQYRLCLSFKLTTRACLDSGKTEPGRLSAGQ